jgi:hypothetical protein
LIKAAEELCSTESPQPDTPAYRLMKIIEPNYDTSDAKTRLPRLQILLRARPAALIEAARMLISYPDEILAIMTRYPYTDPSAIGGYLDRDLPDSVID